MAYVDVIAEFSKKLDEIGKSKEQITAVNSGGLLSDNHVKVHI